ncbi:hypothetical protein O53_2121 [Microcystis aeruginosa TAIHU98]|uniref:Uncharacterized protein n=1 Tax=Microcystis aeruginosa TAIHU98 TaxID=1134457 RepID=L7E4T8_MICAE|nr:hypothetical protein O53_2121 [Microcystis aeruginosa TAIHU98]
MSVISYQLSVISFESERGTIPLNALSTKVLKCQPLRGSGGKFLDFFPEN